MNRRKPYGLYIMLVLAVLWIVFFLCAPYIAPYNPEATNVADRLQDISSTHWLGTDQLAAMCGHASFMAGRHRCGLLSPSSALAER